MINLIKKFFAPTVKEESAFYLADEIIDLQEELQEKVAELEKEIAELEKENRELHDLVLEIETSLKSQIDKIHPVIYNISESNKGK